MVNIYVGNLAWKATEDDLRDAFEEFGEVASVSIITDRASGRSKGFGFVEMHNEDEARDAIDKLDGAEIQGRPVKVNEARPRSERPASGPRPGGDRRW